MFHVTTLLLSLLLLSPLASSRVASTGIALQKHASGQVPFIKLVPRGNHPQWVKAHGGSWVPTAEQLHAVRQAFEAYVKHAAKVEHINLAPWPSYTFQYQGRLFHGHKVVFVNAFCAAPAGPPSNEIIVVSDGGPCYFRAWWSPKRRSFVGIIFNGVA